MKLHRIAAIAFTTLSIVSMIRGQQVATNIVQLEDEVAKLTAIDRNPETPEELRHLNRSFLDERRTRLRLLLGQKISTLTEYRRLVSLSAAESHQLNQAIHELEIELNDLKTADGSSVESHEFLLPESMAGAIFNSTGSAMKTGKKSGGKPDVTTIQIDQLISTVLPDGILKIEEDDCFDAELANLIDSTLGADLKDKSSDFEQKDYCLVHLAKWGQTRAANGDKHARIDKDGWFLYKRIASKPIKDCAGRPTTNWERQSDYDGKRIYGSKRVAVLMVHMSVPPDLKEDITYKVAVQKRTPAPFENLMTLVGTLTGAGTAADKAQNIPINVWGGKLIVVEDIPSDLVVSASIAVQDQQTQEFTRTYQNEGRYHWDVSVGVPVKTIRELQFVSDGNKVTTTGKDRQDVYGFLNIYPVAVDVSADKLAVAPHFVLGVPLASKPLQHPFAGIGYGVYKSPIKFNLFAGVIFNRELVPKTLATGSTATPSQLEADLHARWVRKFTWGINFPIGQIKNAIKK